MTSLADAAAVRTFLARAERREALRGAATGCACGLTLGLAFIGISIATRQPVNHPLVDLGVAMVIGLLAGWLVARDNRATLTARIERRVAASRNLVTTAAEMLGQPHRNEYVGTLVMQNAAALVQTIRMSTVVPLRATFIALAIVAGVAHLAISRPVGTLAAVRAAETTATRAPAIQSVDAEVILPAYVRRSGATLHDPSRIEAFVGSRIRLTVHAAGTSVTIESLHGRQLLKSTTPGTFTDEFPADVDGFLALEPAADGKVGARRLIGVSVVPDLPPSVRITAPGHDIKLANGHHAIDIAIEADDDIGLASLRLHYTKVSGSGERFTFTDGEVPLAITRTDRRNWKAHVSWKLDSLALDAGDMIVYRAIAADDRPGAAPTESDSYIAEVLAPGGVAEAGFAVDPEVERYALSEQMVILKTEKLAARKATMSPDSLPDAAADIASEQRRVRAEFVFMMGGEVGTSDDATGDLNEVAETEGEGDLAAGRMLNQGRIALMSAIRMMSRADKALTAVDVDGALVQERAALVQLELTFSHTRIILRALTEHERLDLTRRLTGTLADAARDVEPAIEASSDSRAVALRQVLAGIATLAGTTPVASDAPAHATSLAERLLTVDPASQPLQKIAQSLTDAATALGRDRGGEAHDLLDKAATALAVVLRGDLLNAPAASPALGVDEMAGALTDALRRGRGGP